MTRQCSLWFRLLLPRRDSVPCCRCDCCVVTLALLPRRQTLGRPVCRRGGVANFRTSVCKCHQSHKRLCWAGTRVFSCTQEPVLLVKLQQFDIVERKYTACNIYSYWLTLHSTIWKPLKKIKLEAGGLLCPPPGSKVRASHDPACVCTNICQYTRM